VRGKSTFRRSKFHAQQEEFMIEHNCRGFRLPKAWAGKIRKVKIASLLIACLLILVEGCLGSSDPARASQAVAHIEGLSVVVQPSDGTYEIQTGMADTASFTQGVAAEIDHKWVKSTDYPKHEISQSSFEDALGHGKKITVTSSGLPNFPDLAYTLQIYDGRAFGVIEAEVQNHTGNPVTIQSIRSVEAVGNKSSISAARRRATEFSRTASAKTGRHCRFTL
jgi:hypothetical protein